MAAVLYSAGTDVDSTLVVNKETHTWVSPSTMDSADTVVVPTRTGATVRVKSCIDNTTGDTVTATVSSYTVTIDAAGGTTDHIYVLEYMYV